MTVIAAEVPAAPILQRQLRSNDKEQERVCICGRRGDGSLTPSSCAVFAAACQAHTVHRHALPVSCDRNPMLSIWCDYATWRANESSCATKLDVPASPATTRPGDGRFSRRQS